MPLLTGSKLGPYEVLGPLGVGGMGEVYQAADTTLKRSVALKVLPAAVATDPDRLARFQREAEVLASLNHPNIAAIYGVASADDVKALVMEYVEGDDLAETLSRGALPATDALPIALQIAQALEAAHDKGIIHRDLKPANVKLRPDGTIKVLDFGLAKAIAAEGATTSGGVMSMATITSPAHTQMGMILGTAAYMAPEQARGKPVDKRADIWAFGCVLYELLTGRRAFPGDEVADVIAAVITREPDLALLPAETPLNVRAVLARCLAKDPRERLRDIGDARLLLAERAEPHQPAFVAPARRSPIVSILAVALGIVLIALGVTLFRPRPTSDPQPVRLTMTFPEGSQPQKGQPLPSMALSPDGRTFVYTAAGGPEGTQLWRRDLNDFAAKPIPGTGGGQGPTGSLGQAPRQAFFSPDGKSIGFVTGNAIRTLPITLGLAKDVCTVFDGVTGATWTDQNEIVFAASGGKQGLWRVPAAGGAPVKVANGAFYYPDALPGGRAVIVTMPNATAERSSSDLTLAAVTLATGAITKILDGGTYVRYAPTGHLVFGRDGALVVSTFDSSTFAVGEARTPVVTDFWMDPSFPSGNYAVSASGTLVYAPGAATDFERTLVTIDGDDTRRPLIQDRRYYAAARMSPKGRHVAVMQRAWEDRLLLVDTLRGTVSRLTSSPHASEYSPVWSPDGRQVAFSAYMDGKSGIYLAPVDNSSAQPTMIFANHDIATPTSFSRDGQQLVFDIRQEATGYDLMMVSMGPEHAVKPLLQTNANERDAAVSPDNQAIAYQSSRTGRAEIWVSDFPTMQNAVQVSTDGGALPVWAAASGRLYFKNGPRVMTADVSRRSTGDIPRPIAGLLFPQPYPSAFIDVMPDGKFLAIDGPVVGGGRELRVIVNWFSELKDKMR
jgi:serine/threonine protein kinase